MHLGSFRNCMKLVAKDTELVQLMQYFVPVIFPTNAPDPPHWTLNLCFGVFDSVWVHLGSFRNCMKLGAKQGELVQLMQKFVPRSHGGIFSQRMHQIRPIAP